MMLRLTLFVLCCFSVVLGHATKLNAAQPPKSTTRPNVVFILTDDQRWDQLGCAGHPFLKTPHIDRLAEEGAYFENMFVTTSLCSPSRASFLSGLYANTHGVVNNFTDYPHDLASFPKQLQTDGYQTAYIGKWHMGEDDDTIRPGFDYWVTHKGQGDYFDTTFNVQTKTSQPKRSVFKGYYSTVVTDIAIDWLETQQESEKPFCLILGHKAPHTPFTPEPKYEHDYDNIPIGYPRSAFRLEGKPKWVEQRLDTWHGIYGPIYGFRKNFPDRSASSVLDFDRFVQHYTACIRSIDDSVGRVYAALLTYGMLENTIVVFAGDNGMFLGEHGMSDKRAMHEPSIRVPQIVRYPKVIKPGTRVPQQVLNIDLAPSLLDLCGAPAIKNVHGVSWVPALNDPQAKLRDGWYYEYNYEKQFPYTPNVRGVRTDRWKYMRYPHGDGGKDRHMAELYDIKNDPGELNNLISTAKPELVQRLSRLLDELIKKSGDKSYQTLPIDEGIQSQLPDENIR